eukprot:CAMPEP_0119565374 /NCGR_PEP_ID=MMETSP1352-20130426/29797_1 /TAXON_ID=265584 /ORGANISM="Stauroneis constricta, Strain CCMP1120" /LENGTH=876 /DNA_ID=CAMNT_0007614265 /DNA_START=1 /DNA_END=2631 /DNA_ORIENTATION=-
MMTTMSKQQSTTNDIASDNQSSCRSLDSSACDPKMEKRDGTPAPSVDTIAMTATSGKDASSPQLAGSRDPDPLDFDDADHSQSGLDSGNNSSSNRGASYLHGDHRQECADDPQHPTLAGRETKQITYARLVVFAILMASALAVSILVYYYIEGDERKDFETQFETHAQRILELFHKSVEDKLKVLDSFSSTITSYALDTGATFPNVTVPNFEVRGCNTRVLAEGLLMYYVPVVLAKDRAGWEAYAMQNHGHLVESYRRDTELRQRQDRLFGLEEGRRNLARSSGDSIARQLHLTHDPPFHPEIFRTDRPAEEEVEPLGASPYYMPIWQMTPVLDLVPILNLNLMSYNFLHDGLIAAYESKQAVIDQVTNLQDPDSPSKTNAVNIDVFKIFLDASQFRHGSEEYLGDPVSPVAYPVFDSFDDDRKVVGITHTNIYWRLYFQSLLSPDIRGIICVLENTLDQQFSFRLDGEDVTYLGTKDQHDPKYDEMVEGANIAEYVASIASPETRSYTAADLNGNYSNYKIRVYPTSTLEDKYITNAPIWYAVVVGMVFVFTSAVFVFYDCLVERRQRVVMDRAVKSGAVVSSLFPENVRDRLYNEHGDRTNSKTTRNSFMGSKLTSSDLMRSTSFGSGRRQRMGSTPLSRDGRSEMANDKPIADKFEDTTILFADLVGFTKWSASKTPEQVFDLLEILYGAFDKLSKRHRVFKVETIGDCYMAATGLPLPQPKHATIMVHFAHDCLRKMNSLLPMLSSRSGSNDTMDLALRIGIHSGQVTAGVLRGEKSRFQLFGDAVNTASRMESTSEPCRIQCSQSTADELILGGKRDWLELRKETIEVKGKGKMQTYFVMKRRQKSSADGRPTEAMSSSSSEEESNTNGGI